MHFTVNGHGTEIACDVRTSLLDLLRDHLGLPGTKKGCNQGACGACTVLVDGARINACLALAVQYEGREIVTIEGIGGEGIAGEGLAAEELTGAPALHPIQATFVQHDGFQCGYCTPGQICSALGMLAEFERGVPSAVTQDLGEGAPALTHDELRERMSGNLCRCGAYNGIIDAIRATLPAEASA
jgi:xanthine dehydrogenase YagT iron-sulfur-binding subunit